MPAFVDRSGKRYGRLTAQWPTGRNKHGQIVWLCVCECGALVRKVGFHNSSCGCLLKESAARNGAGTKGKPRPSIRGNKFAARHGHCSHGLTPCYQSYQAAKQRCTDPNAENYPDYGGRGIEFRFTSFEQWYAELGDRPHGMTVDRIRNNGHYEPGNVRWATAKQQRHNQRSRRCRSQQ